MLGGEGMKDDPASQAIVGQFLGQFTGGDAGVIHKRDFVQAIMKNRELLELLSPFYGANQ